jgi:hypothetical protein
MARYAALLLASTITPILDTGMYNLNRSVVLPAAGISNGDYVPVATVQRNGRIVGSKMNISATLGAGCDRYVGALPRRRAGAEPDRCVNRGRGEYRHWRGGWRTSMPQAGDEIVMVCSGANITASATADIDVHIQH